MTKIGNKYAGWAVGLICRCAPSRGWMQAGSIPGSPTSIVSAERSGVEMTIRFEPVPAG
jgi:hypothetical protein